MNSRVPECSALDESEDGERRGIARPAGRDTCRSLEGGCGHGLASCARSGGGAAVTNDPVRMWHSLDEVPPDLPRSVVMVGNFDGVHRGHQAVVQRARALAVSREGPVVALIFDPHPMAVLRPQHAPSTLTSIERRADLLHAIGVDAVLALPFDGATALWEPTTFVETVLVHGLHAAVVVVGSNFRFGRTAAGDVRSLRELGIRHGYDVEEVALEGGPQVWSASYVRVCLTTGDVAGATEALGRPFTMAGTVVHGDKRGRQLGFPTANVPTSASMAAPADGVYAGWLSRGDTGEWWPAAISVGSNPTFGGGLERRVESHVLDRRDLDLYGVEVEISFVRRIRRMVAFDSVAALVDQMHADVDECRRILGSRAIPERKGG
jgi:riboflavin kinase/FMN adenylyltransferase